MRVELEEIERITQRIKELNNTDLSKIEVTAKGKTIELSKKSIDDWKFTGLSNFAYLQDIEIKEPPSQGRLNLS